MMEPGLLKFESLNFQNCKKKKKKYSRKLVFWVYPEQLLSHIIFEHLHCYEVTLEEKNNKPLLQKGETNIFD